MPSRIAQRSRKTAKKTSKRVVLYVPNAFDPETHLPEELRHLADYARYLLHRINVGRVHLRRGNCLVYLKHDYLAKFMPRGRFTMIRDALEEAGVIHVRKFCLKGQMCYGYRLLDPHDQGFSHYRPTTKRLLKQIMAWRAKEFRDVRLPIHRDLRRFVKSITIDEIAAMRAVHGRPFERSAQVAMIQRIVNGDCFTVSDRFGRFHTNLTNLKASLRPFLRYRDSRLCNLDIANSQPMIFCLLLVNLLSNKYQLENLIDYSFQKTSNAHLINIDQDYLDSLSSNFLIHEIHNQEEGESGNRDSPILPANYSKYSPNLSQNNMLEQINNQQSFPNNQDKEQEEGEGGGRDSPILHVNALKQQHNTNPDNNLGRINNRQTLPVDVIDFINLCEQGILYDDLMRRLNISPSRRDSFKRLFFSQVFFGKIKITGRVRELFSRDFPTVLQAINDLKRKDYRQLAYLLQAHESKIMLDIICRKILDELPGTFIATIHDSIMTTPDKADEVKSIMMREFRRFGLKPTIRLEAY